MNKYDAVCEALPIVCPEYEVILKKYSDNAIKYGRGRLLNPITGELFISLISRTKYNLSELGLSAASTTRLLKELFPGRTSTTGEKVCGYVLSQVGLKQCARCEQALPFEEFRANKSTKSGLNTYCKQCHLETTKVTQTARQSKYRAAKLSRTVPWSELEKIKEFIRACPTGYHVDHVIPLQGELVSGLHVLNNLQYLPAKENCSKRNKFTIQ